MSNNVFANGREISCKKADGKSICAFPDVCFTPPDKVPPTPPGVPIPYPNTGMAKDTTGGSKKVKISDQEILLKNKSYFKKTVGNEAGCATKKGLVTSKTTGKAYFNAWSMDVKVEGENVVRHLDLTTHNHGSFPGNSPPWAYADEAATVPIEACKTEVGAAEEACSGLETRDEQCDDEDCNAAKKCLLVTKSQGDRDSQSTQVGCCGDDIPHHMIEGHGLQEPGPGAVALDKFPDYVYNDAPCVCAEGDRWTADHGAMHQSVGKKETAAVRAAGKKNSREPDFAWNYKEAKSAAVNAHQKVFAAGCTRACLEAQLDSYHNSVGCYDKSLLRTYDVEAAGHI